MCYDDSASPPIPPSNGGSVASSEDLTLTAADGTNFMAYVSRAAHPNGTGIVVLPDVRGLHAFYKELADRFAEIGFNTVSIDYFGRTAEDNNRDESFVYRPHVDQTTPDGVDADIAAGIAYLGSEAGGSITRVFTVGFCFGGGVSWRQSATQPGLAGAVGFYGVPSRIQDWIGEMKAPLLLLIAGEDFTPVTEFETFSGQLNDANVPHHMVVYEGAPHSYFDRTFDQHRAACADSWQQILSFIESPPTA